MRGTEMNEGVRVVETLTALIGALSDDELALVRTLTPPEVEGALTVEHLFDLVDVLSSIRRDEAVAEYVYAIAPGWDGTVEALLLAARVTTTLNRYELEHCVPLYAG